jgi:DnaD/phage-associated family protein
MYRFEGFPEGKTHLIPVPEAFFRDILPNLDHQGELKLFLCVIWILDQMEGPVRYLLPQDLVSNEEILAVFGKTPHEAEATLSQSLELAVEHGLLLEVNVELEGGSQTVYFLNSPKGRAAMKAIELGEWRPTGDSWTPIEMAPKAPNIFRLYEENIGPLTPLIADALAEAEETYPDKWIEDAFRIAVAKNNRNWHYVAAILKRWKQRGKYERKDRRDSEEARKKYAEWEN